MLTTLVTKLLVVCVRGLLETSKLNIMSTILVTELPIVNVPGSRDLELNTMLTTLVTELLLVCIGDF